MANFDYRIHGPELAADDAFLDVEVKIVNPRDKSIVLRATDGSKREWSIDIGRLGDLLDDNLAVEVTDKKGAPQAKAWQYAKKVHSKVSTGNRRDEAVKALFRAGAESY